MNWNEIVLENLNPPQQEAVLQTEGPLLILAGAGSGKTRTIVHRIANLIHVKKVAPWKIIAVTFTNKAAAEMKQRAISLAGPIAEDCVIRTFHSLGLYFLRIFCEYLNYPPQFTIWDDTDQVRVLQLLLESKFKKKVNKTEVRFYSNLVSGFKDQLLAPEDGEKLEELLFAIEESEKVDLEILELVPELYRYYEEYKSNSLAMDFADLIYQPVKLFQKHRDALEKLHNRYHYFLIDEYQDTNHAQYTLIQLLAECNKNLCVVGDDDQAIYGWRGADVTNILEFHNYFDDAKIIKLEENYRSTEPILNLANQVIVNNSGRMEKTLFTNITGGSLPKLMESRTDLDEARGIAALVETLQINGCKEIAVLYRTNAQSRLIEEALLQKQLPYKIFGGISFFARQEIKDIIAYLQILINPKDAVSFLRIINTPSRGIGEKTLQKILSYQSTLNSKAGSDISYIELLSHYQDIPVSKKVINNLEKLYTLLINYSAKLSNRFDFGMFFEDILTESGLKEMYDEEDKLLSSSRIENLNELKSSLMNYQLDHKEANLADYLQDISLYAGSKDNNTDSGVLSLMTIHNAKGLEFEVVIVAGLDENTIPHFLSIKEGNFEEERRLLYVAITRAKKKLFLTRSETRFRNGWQEPTSPSRFLNEIDKDAFEKSVSKFTPSGYSANKKLAGSRKSSSNFKNYIPNEIADKSNISMGSTSDGLLKNGDKVSHPSFGKGKVFKIEGKGDATKIHIYFNDGKSRKFILKYTKLEKL